MVEITIQAYGYTPTDEDIVHAWAQLLREIKDTPVRKRKLLAAAAELAEAQGQFDYLWEANARVDTGYQLTLSINGRRLTA